MTTNYIVTIQDFTGKRSIECESIEETWITINSMALGGLYNVSSPTGLDVSEFIPF